MANQIDTEKWDDRLAQAVGRNLKRAREEQRPKVTVGELSSRLEKLGHPIKRTVLTNLETGRRSYLSLADVLAIASALRIPPMALIAPPGTLVEAGPGVEISATQLTRWFGGIELPDELVGELGPEDLRAWVSASTFYKLQIEMAAAMSRVEDAQDKLRFVREAEDLRGADPLVNEVVASDLNTQKARDVTELRAAYQAELRAAMEEEQRLASEIRRLTEGGDA